MIDKDRRVAVWWREQRGAFEGPQTLEPMFLLGPEKPGSNYHGATYEPLYDQAELDAAVAAERERCDDAREIETLRALLAECLPHVRSAAQASHLTDGFRPRCNALDELVERVESASNSQPNQENKMSDTKDEISANDQLGRLPTVARLYYTGHGSRRYKRASVHNGPGEALTFVSLAEERVRQAVAAERKQWKAKAIEACNSAGDGPDNGCCPTYWEEAREACIAAIQKA